MVKVRGLRREDFFSFMNLLFRIFPHRYDPATFTSLYEIYPKGMLVAEADGEIVGFLVGIKSSRDKARILLLGVKDGFRRRGIGSLLLKRFLIEMTFEGVKQVRLEVRISNREAISFYRKHGFSMVRLIKGLYEDGEDGYLMVKML